MFSKKYIIFYIVILNLLALGLYELRSDYLFNNITNPDLYKKYENTAVRSSAQYTDIKATAPEKYLFIYDTNEKASSAIRDNVLKVFSYMKKDVNSVDVSLFNGEFVGYNCVVLDFENFSKFSYLDKLFEYVKNGGSLIIAERPVDDGSFTSVYRKFGMYEKGLYKMCKGMELLNNDLIIKGKGLKRGESITTDSISAQLDNSCKVYCTSIDKTPLIWSNDYGNGKILFFNNQYLIEKQNRGLFAGAISRTTEKFIYPIMDMKLNSIDDFPAPIPVDYNDGIYKEYGKNIVNFYKDVWWPDMLKNAKKYDAKYTGYLIETYNDWVIPSFDKVRSTESKTNFAVFSKELIGSGGELGIHGYNHLSLALKGFIKNDIGYKSWPNNETMMYSVQEVDCYIKSVFPNYQVRSYVPPSNIISPEGVAAIKNAVPSIKAISSLYDVNVGGDAYQQEFQINKDGIVDIPRLSSGYEMTEGNKWDIYNGVTTHGVFSHFVHPDDVLDKERSNSKGWKKMQENYDDLMKEVYNKFGWLRSMTITPGAVEMSRYLETETVFKYDRDTVKGFSNKFKDESYFMFRTDRKISKTLGCSFEKIDENAYLIKVSEPEFTIGMGD